MADRLDNLRLPPVVNKTFMNDLKFQKMLKTVRVEFHRRMGREMCKELHADCCDCKTRFLIGLVNFWIDLLEPIKISKKNKPR